VNLRNGIEGETKSHKKGIEIEQHFKFENMSLSIMTFVFALASFHFSFLIALQTKNG
jgi:hypothetical protein